VIEQTPNADWPHEPDGPDKPDRPEVRTYVITNGRTAPKPNRLDRVTVVLALGPVPHSEPGLQPEHINVLGICMRAVAVVEIAAHLKLPLGVVQVLLEDLLERRLISMRQPSADPGPPDRAVLEQVRRGLAKL
jgi:hypothetical protein